MTKCTPQTTAAVRTTEVVTNRKPEKKRTKLEIWVDRSSNGKLTIIRGTTKYQQNLHPLSRHGKSSHTWGDMRLAKARKSAKMLSALDGEKVK